MSDNLKDLIEKNIKSNESVLKCSGRKYYNQESREIDLRRKLKKYLIYGAIFSMIGLGIYGYNHYRNKYKDYVGQQNKKIVYYQNKFDNVKDYYKGGNYMDADRLSKKLQEEMSNESFLSPTNDLYDKVKEYDDKYIDPQVKRVKRERLKRKFEELPDKIKNKYDETKDKVKGWWSYDASPKEKGAVIVGGMFLLAIICKILAGRSKELKK